MNQQEQEIFTSTGKKILRHLDILSKFQKTGIIQPISLQVAPTSRCNLNCVFCSNVNRNKHEDLGIWKIFSFVAEMKRLGLKTVEWTGGGDPTQYEYINEVIAHSYYLSLKQGFITNGIDLVKNLDSSIVNYLDWMRISLNSLDYVGDIDIPENYKGTLGFSYVINDKTNEDTFPRIKEYVKKHNPKYVRIVPNCQTDSDRLDRLNESLPLLVSSLGPPFFYQTKIFAQPKRCWWGHFKPFLLHDGYIYPCSSVVLNNSAERCFHSKFRWYATEDFVLKVKEPAKPYDCKDCTNCVFGEQNELIEACLNQTMVDFI